MKKYITLYGLLLLLLSFNLSSHSHGYWPGDTWLFRSGYWFTRLLIESTMYYGCFRLLAHYIPRQTQWMSFALALLLSSIPFTLSLAMIDIATGRPDSYQILSELERTGAISAALLAEWVETIPRHAAFCGLLFFIQQQLKGGESPPEAQNGANYLTIAENDASERERSKKEEMSQHERAHQLSFMQKLSTQNDQPPVRIQAQEHYISITTPDNTELVQYRFGDALKEVKTLAGQQVHRSFWVADNNVKGWQQTIKGIKLALHYGEAVPVSRRFEHKVKEIYPNYPSSFS